MKDEFCIVSGILLFFICLIAAITYDCSQLTHYDYNGYLVDKWHEESCSGYFNGNGSYLGESCSDEYTAVVIIDDERNEFKLDKPNFSNLRIDSEVNVQYDLGRLGLRHNLDIN